MTITDEQLVEYVTGELPEAQTAAVERHLVANPNRQAVAERIREVVFTMRTDDTAVPGPASVRRTLDAIARERRSALSEWIERATRFVAELVFDSRMQFATAGHRGLAEAYQLGFDCAAARIDLSVTPPASRQRGWRVRGRVATRGPESPGRVVLRIRGTRTAVAQTAVDERGRFVIDPEPGVYDLVVQMGEDAAIAGGVEVG